MTGGNCVFIERCRHIRNSKLPWHALRPAHARSPKYRCSAITQLSIYLTCHSTCQPYMEPQGHVGSMVPLELPSLPQKLCIPSLQSLSLQMRTSRLCFRMTTLRAL